MSNRVNKLGLKWLRAQKACERAIAKQELAQRRFMEAVAESKTK